MNLVYETGISPYVSESFHQVDRTGLKLDGSLPKRKHIRWAAFLKNGTEQEAAAVLKDLKLDNDTINRVKVLVRWINVPLIPDKTQLRRVMSRMEPELYDDLMTLKRFLSPQVQSEEELEKIWSLSRQIRESRDCTGLKELAVTGADVIAAGVKPGKAVGEVLTQLLDLVLEDPEKNRREYLVEEIKKISFS